MEDPEDLSMDRLELCSYRYLQQLAKSYGFPSNVKKVYLLEMIHARKYSSKEELEEIVTRVKEERGQMLKVRKPTKRKKKFLQGTEISSTSNQSSSRTSDYIVTYPPSPNRQAVIKYRRSNILQPTVAKKTNESDRVLRSFNSKVRRDYSIFNSNNSFLRVIKAEQSLQQTIHAWSAAFQNHKPFNVSKFPEQKHVPTNCEEFSRQNVNFKGHEERQLVPLPGSANISSKPVKHLRRLSSIYSLKPPEQAQYQYLPSIEFRRHDGRISKINSMVPISIRKKIPENTNTNTRTCIIRPTQSSVIDVRPISKKTSNVDYKIDLSNSSTESAIDSGTENFSLEKVNLKTYAETKKRATVNLVRYSENQANRSLIGYSKSGSLIAESRTRYGENSNATENLNKYIQYRRQTIDKKVPENVNTVTSRPLENKSYAAENLNRQAENRCFTVNTNRQQNNRSLIAVNPKRQTGNYDFALNSDRYATNSNRAIENQNRQSEGRSNVREHLIENSNQTVDKYIDFASYPHANPNRYKTRNIAIENQNRYLEKQATVNLTRDQDYWAAKNPIRYEEIGRRTEPIRHVEIRTPESYIGIENHSIDNPSGYTETENHSIDNARGYTEMENHNLNRYIGSGTYLTDYRNTLTESRSYSEAPMIYTESRNYIGIPNRPTEIENVHEHTDNTNNNEHMGIWNANDYPNMSALTENQGNEKSTNASIAVYYQKKMRPEQVGSQRSSTPLSQTTDNERLPSIAEAFSHLNSAQYKSFTQPLYVQVSEESERTMSPSIKGGIVLEQLYNLTGQSLTTSNEPLLRVVTTTSTVCVYSTHIMTSAETRPPTTAGNDYDTHSFEQGSQHYDTDSEKVPRLYDYFNMGEQETNYLKCDEVLRSSCPSLAEAVKVPQLGANVTIREMVEDALELISQDGDYMERIGIDERMKCFECDWAGPKLILELHLKMKHVSLITDQASSWWVKSFRLGELRGAVQHVSHVSGRLYVLTAGVKRGILRAGLTIIPNASEETTKYCRLTVYNKVTGEPYSWEGGIPYIPDTEPYHEQINGLKLDITSLNLLPNSANLKLINGELVATSLSKAIVGEPELDDLEISIHVRIFC